MRLIAVRLHQFTSDLKQFFGIAHASDPRPIQRLLLRGGTETEVRVHAPLLLWFNRLVNRPFNLQAHRQEPLSGRILIVHDYGEEHRRRADPIVIQRSNHPNYVWR